MRFISTLTLCSALLGGCSQKNKEELSTQSLFDKVTEVRIEEDGVILQRIDLNNDGIINIENTLRERSSAARLLLMKKVDLDLNGDFEIVSYFDETGQLKLEETDKDYDGLLDTRDHYENGMRVKSEYDSDGDGRTDVFTFYVRGEDGRPRVDRKERDTNADGVTDHWERYGPDGEVIRAGADTDGDGTVDERLE